MEVAVKGSDDVSLAEALVAVAMASVFWGSNFVVVKNYDMGDGIMFQLFMCVGIMLVGTFTLFFAPEEDRHVKALIRFYINVKRYSVDECECSIPRADIQGDYDAFPFPDFAVVFSTEGLLGGIVWCIGNLVGCYDA